MTNEVDSTGHYVLRHHTLVTLRFCDIGLEYFQWWNHQNVLSGLEIRAAEQSSQCDREAWSIEVEMSSSFGCEAKLRCNAVKILMADDFGNNSQGGHSV